MLIVYQHYPNVLLPSNWGYLPTACRCLMIEMQWNSQNIQIRKNIDYQPSKYLLFVPMYLCVAFFLVFLFIQFIVFHFRLQEDTGECNQWGYLRPLPKASDLPRPGTDMMHLNYLHTSLVLATIFRFDFEYAFLFFCRVIVTNEKLLTSLWLNKMPRYSLLHFLWSFLCC